MYAYDTEFKLARPALDLVVVLCSSKINHMIIDSFEHNMNEQLMLVSL